MAPCAAEVVGVDASLQRVSECQENAAPLRITNTRFLHVPAGAPLPFADGRFDGAMAACSIEQTPDPAATPREIRRVLRPGGRLRMWYESLRPYRGGREQAVWLMAVDEGHCRLLLYDRRPDDERVVQYALAYSLPAGNLRELLWPGGEPSFLALTSTGLARSLAHLIEARVATTIHSSGPT